MGSVFANSKGAISLNAVVAAASGAPVPGRHGRTTKGTIVTGAGVTTGSAILQGSHDATFPNTPVVLETIDLATLGASNSQSTLDITQRFPFYRWVLTGTPGGTVTGYIQHWRD